MIHKKLDILTKFTSPQTWHNFCFLYLASYKTIGRKDT